MKCKYCSSDSKLDPNKKYTISGDIVHADGIYTTHYEYFCSIKCFNDSCILDVVKFEKDPNTLSVQELIDKLNKISDKTTPVYFADDDFDFHSITDIRSEDNKILIMEL